ncbi:MAG: hypothetical protein WA869_14745 [Alloacidobacterium sp.]
MCRRFSAALVFALLAASPLQGQHPPLSLCLVQTKPNAAAQYDPPPGPWAIELDKLLATQELRTGAKLQITLLAASTEKDVLPEARRLQCPYIVELWYHQSHPASGRYAMGDEDSLFSQWNDGDSLFFSLWNGDTGKVIARGASPIRLVQDQTVRRSNPLVAEPSPCAALAQQIVKHLNKLP